MDRGIVLDWFEEVLNNTATKVFHNAMYDVSWIRSMGYHINGGIVDTMIAASLCDENRYSYTLDAVSKQYIGAGKNEKLLQEAAKDWGIDPKAEMWRLPSAFVGEYAEKDAEITLKLYHALQHEITKQDLWDVFNLETNLFPCLVDMKFKGVRVDIEKAQAVKEQLVVTEKELLRDIKKLVGFEVIGKGIARQHYQVFNYKNENIGVVTSGSMSPSLNIAIGMAYVIINEAQVENKILIKVRNKYIDAKIVNLPFL